MSSSSNGMIVLSSQEWAKFESRQRQFDRSSSSNRMIVLSSQEWVRFESRQQQFDRIVD